mgnify:CR=1 FL=1
MDKKVFELDFYGRKIVVEHGQVAKQADGAVLVRYGDTVVLSTAVVSKSANLLSDFFPLMVLYQEKLYSVGKIPGGFIKREGRPTDAATLAARMIDRPLRPLFPEDFKNEVQIVNTVLSVDQDNSPELTALFGSSLATCISKIPFNGPVAAVKVGRVGGKFIINPTVAEAEVSDIDLTVAGTKDAINMVEAGAREASEDDMLEALLFGHEAIKKLIAFEEEVIASIGEEKMEYAKLEITEKLRNEVDSIVRERLDKALRIKDKLEKYNTIDSLEEEVVEKYKTENEDNMKPEQLKELLTKVALIFHGIEYELFRNIVVKEKKRADGRAMDEIRPLSTDIDLLPRCHGSALFTRGETQSLATVTLGALGEHQILDGLGIEDAKRFMLHYNFPAFSVGETGRYGAPGRREIGHGALGERALSYVIPSEEEFPYTIRVVSEILESNGSSSQATICAGTMALMAAGVPIKKPVAGISTGLVTSKENPDEYVMLTDIQGIEDFFGDMDFKVGGTKDGITAIQVDIKNDGLTYDIIKEAFERTKVARDYILDEIMKPQIAEPRAELSKYAPRIITTTINVDKIKDVIGPGGKMINKIIDATGVKVDIEEDGRVCIYTDDAENGKKALKMIEDIAKDIEVGKVYDGKVTRIMNFGAFVDIGGGREGLLHISKISNKRVEKVEDVLAVGDEIKVKVYEIDNQDRINLTMKDLEENKENKEEHVEE